MAELSGGTMANGESDNDDVEGDSDNGDNDVILPAPTRDPPPFLKFKAKFKFIIFGYFLN